MSTLKQILAAKQQLLAVVAPRDTVLHALRVMADHDVGAVLVLDGERLVGIFSERDYARKVVLRGHASKDLPVSEVMTGKVAFVTPERSVEECMAIMSERRFRHLPVLADDGTVLGIVSIGDLVKDRLCEQQFIIEQLEHYITGGRAAG